MILAQGRASSYSLAAENWVVVLASTGVFFVALELTIVSIALPGIADGLNAHGDSGFAWIYSGYNLAVASCLLGFGWLADRVGRRRLFLAGLYAFSCGSVVSGLAGSLEQLILGRVLQGFGGSMMLPASLALILSEVALERRERAIAAWSAMAGLAAALGPVLGGMLVTTMGWRAVFLVNVPIALLAVYLSYRHIAERAVPKLVQYPNGSGTASELRDFLGAPVMLASLESFRWAGAATLPFVAAFTAWVVMVPSFFSQVWGYSTIVTGLAMLPAPLAMLLAAQPAARLIDKLDYRGLILAGALLALAGLLWWWWLIPLQPSYLLAFLPGALLFGIGVGFGFPMLAAAAVSDVPASRYAIGAAGVTTLRQLSMALGAALAIFVVGKPQGLSPIDLLANHSALWLVCAGLLACAAFLCFFMPKSRELAHVAI